MKKKYGYSVHDTKDTTMEYISFVRDTKKLPRAVETKQLREGLNVDLDKEGNIIGIEIIT